MARAKKVSSLFYRFPYRAGQVGISSVRSALLSPGKVYNHLMEHNISFHTSAFKHGITEADVRWAFKTFIFEEPIEGEQDKYLLVGYDLAGNPLEILFNEVGEDSYYVFHAMRCRKQLREIANI